MRLLPTLVLLSGAIGVAQEKPPEDGLYRGRNADQVVTELLPLPMRQRLRQQIEQAIKEPSKSEATKVAPEPPPPVRRSRPTPADM